MGSWVRSITSPFRKACVLLTIHKDSKKKSQQAVAGCDHDYGTSLQGEVMACAYEDVHVMWSILDKSSPRSM